MRLLRAHSASRLFFDQLAEADLSWKNYYNDTSVLPAMLFPVVPLVFPCWYQWHHGVVQFCTTVVFTVVFYGYCLRSFLVFHAQEAQRRG